MIVSDRSIVQHLSKRQTGQSNLSSTTNENIAKRLVHKKGSLSSILAIPYAKIKSLNKN
jgi:hypothetical protein